MTFVANAIPALMNALTYASIFALVALGLAIVFGMMDIMNMAHGEFITIGAYALSLVQTAMGSHESAAGYCLGLLAAVTAGAIAGVILEFTIIRPLRHRTFDALLATFAISLIVQQGIELVFGTQPQIVSAPYAGTVTLFGVAYPGYRIIIVLLAIFTVVGFSIIFTRTRVGTDLRAVFQNPEMAEAVGINTRLLNRIAFSGGAALAALAGALIAPLATVDAMMGQIYLGKAFFVIVLGGIGSVFGSLVGSLLVGASETFLDYVVDPSLSSAVVLVLAIVVIRFRPRGLIPGFSIAHHMLGRG